MSSVDIRGAFWSLPLTHEASMKCAVITPTAQYLPKRALQGLANSPNHFAMVMHQILHDLQCVIFYQDDLCIVSKEPSIDAHLRDIKTVLQRLGSYGLKVNGKGHYCQTSIRFLGKIVNRDGIKPLPEHMKALKEYPRPDSVAALQSFVGLMAWLSPYVDNYAAKMHPLHKMISERNISWNDELESLFNRLKEEVNETSFLYFPESDSPMYLATDCSDSCYAAVLYQVKSYTKNEAEALKESLVKFPESSIETRHPVVPLPGKQVPVAQALQAEEGAVGQKTHKLAALNKEGQTLTEIMGEEGVVHQVRVLGLFSGMFQGPAMRYCTLEKEALSLILAVEYFGDFLKMSRRNYLISDAQAILWILRLKQLGISKVVRFAIRLTSYPFHIIVAHIPGSKNPSDLLTRLHKNPVCVRPKEAKKAVVVRTPFSHGQIVTVKDILRELEADPGIVQIPEPEKVSEKKVGLVAALSVASVSRELLKVLSIEALIQAQSEDEKWKLVRERLVQGETDNNYVLHKGLVSRPPKAGSKEEPRIVVPQKSVPSLFAFYHLQCHAGASALSRMIKTAYYVENMMEQLTRFTKACHACAAFKANQTRKQEIGHAPLPLRKASTWVMDIVTGLPPHEGFDAYLSVIDPFSGFRLAVPCRSTVTAKNVCRILREHLIMHFGAPDLLVSDGGSNLLRSDEMVKFCDFYNIKIKVTTPWVSRNHGNVERSNRAITETVSALAHDFGLPWIKLLPIAVAKLNAKPRAYFGAMSPQQIMTGLDPVQRELGGDLVEGREGIQELFKEIDMRTNKLIKDAEAQMLQQNASLGGICRHVPPGTAIYLKSHRVRNKKKTSPRYLHLPMTVIHDFGNVVSAKNFAGIISVVHKTNLKVAQERDVELFDSLPVQAKLIMGEPFTHAEVAEAINDGTIPRFWLKKTQSDERPTKPRTRADTAAEQQAADAAAEELSWTAFPYADDIEDDEEAEGDSTNTVEKRKVRFE